MRLLCVDTATPIESVAVTDGGELLAERLVRRMRGHGPGVLDDIAGVLADADLKLEDLDGLVCGLGPGSFTGLRVALATLKGLALARDLPLYGVSTTRLLCAALPGLRVAAVLDARRGEVFLDGAGLERPVCCAPERVAHYLPAGPPPILVGSGARLYAETLLRALPDATIPSAAALHAPRAALMPSLIDPAHPADLATLEPSYVRRSDAEINYPDGFPDATAVPPQQHPHLHQPPHGPRRDG